MNPHHTGDQEPADNGRNSETVKDAYSVSDNEYLRVISMLAKGVREGDKTSRDAFELACAHGLTWLANPERARELDVQAAQASPVALFLVGVRYVHGLGVAMDASKAESFLEASFYHGFTSAAYYLYCLYSKGVGIVPQNKEKAEHWRRLAE